MEAVYSEIQDIFKKYSVTLYGVADTEFSEYDGKYKRALVFAVPHTETLNLHNYREELFERLIKEARSSINRIIGELETLLNRCRIEFFVPPTAQTSEETLLVPFSYKFASVKAGLGWIGKNDVLITEAYGPRVSVGAILLDYDLPIKTEAPVSKCPADCSVCINACPHKALTGQMWDINQKRESIIDFHLCNQKRSLFIKEHNRKNACGLCMVSCPYGT